MTTSAKNYKIWYFTGGPANFTAHYLVGLFTMEEACTGVKTLRAMGYPSNFQLADDSNIKSANDFESSDEKLEYYCAHAPCTVII